MVTIRHVSSHRPYAMYSPVSMSGSNSVPRFYGMSGGSNSSTESFRANIINRDLVFINFNVNVRGNSLDVDGNAEIRDDATPVANSQCVITAGVTGFYDSGETRTAIASGSQVAVLVDGQAATLGSLTAVTGSVIMEVIN